jgi:hypothetical protein
VLFEVQRGRHSPAQWYQDLHEHQPCQWLAFGLRPARSRLYAFRDRLGPHLDDWHRQLMTQAVDLGVTTAERASLDGSTVAANSSRHRLLNQDSLAKRQAQLAQARAEPAGPVEPRAVAAASPAEPPPASATPVAEPPPAAATPPAGPPLAAQSPAPEPPSAAGAATTEPPASPAGPTTPGWLAPTPAGQQRQQQRYQHAQEQLQQRHADNQQRPADKRLPRPQVRVSVGDPEAALGLDKCKVYRPLYNVQFMPDLDSPLILAYQVFAQATDSGTLPGMLGRYHQATGRYPEKLLTDSTYATALDLALCEQKGVTLYAPYQENPFTAAKRAARPAKQLPKEAFTWLAEEQT